MVVKKIIYYGTVIKFGIWIFIEKEKSTGFLFIVNSFGPMISNRAVRDYEVNL